MANIMKTVFKSKKSKIIAAAVLVAAVAGGTALFLRAQNAKIPEVTLTTASKGQLIKSVTITGDIEARSRSVISLSPASKVVDVLVQEGQRVNKGDVLAILDTSEFKSQLEQQRISLSNARSTLAYISGSSSEMDEASAWNAVGQAEIALDSAESNYDAAQRNLEDIQEFDDSTVRQAEIALDNAESNYRAAKKNLDYLEEQLEQAEHDLHSAQNAYDTAKMNYDAVKILYDSDPVTYSSQYFAAKEALENAEIAVKGAQAALASAQGIYDSGIISARQAVSNAENAVRSAEVTLSNAETKAESDYYAAEKAVSDAENAVRSAKLTLSNARNAASLVGDSTSEKITSQKNQIALLNSQIDYLSDKIEQGNLRANVDGVVTKMDATAGEYPGTGDEIVVDGAMEYLVAIDVSQYDSVSLSAGQKVIVTVKGLGKEYEGTVSEIGQLAEKSLTSTDQDPKVNVKISITNPDEDIKVGYEADAEIIIEDKTDALQVSFEAVQSEAGTGKKYVYTVDSGNVARKTYIKTGIETDYNIEVLSGLTDGQKCISNPDKTITDGMKVREAGGNS